MNDTWFVRFAFLKKSGPEEVSEWTEINRSDLEKYHWAENWPCYVDSRLAQTTFGETCVLVAEGKEIQFI